MKAEVGLTIPLSGLTAVLQRRRQGSLLVRFPGFSIHSTRGDLTVHDIMLAMTLIRRGGDQNTLPICCNIQNAITYESRVGSVQEVLVASR
jgi:hypothetical protein